jgi:hypothetical protein
MYPRSNRGNTPPPSVEFQFVGVSGFQLSAFQKPNVETLDTTPFSHASTIK